mgnify:CR=1 FL=1
MRTKVEQVYNEFLADRRKGYKKEGNYYRPSSAGMCSRKIYYESIEKAEPTNKFKEITYRIFRLGELLHEDIQEAFKTKKLDK